MKANLIIFTLILIASGAYTYVTMNKDNPIFTAATKTTPTALINNQTIENFTYTRLDGSQGTLYDHLGKPTLLHFWATWCTPCLVELPEIIELATQMPQIDILAISTDQKTEKIDHFIKRIKKPIPDNFIIITDSDKSVTQDRFQTFKLPETFILSSQLAIEDKIIGAYDAWLSEEKIKYLKVLSEQTLEQTPE